MIQRRITSAYVNPKTVRRGTRHASTVPKGNPTWDANPTSAESSNASTPQYGQLTDISAAAIAALQNGTTSLRSVSTTA